MDRNIVIAFDTANEVVAAALGRMDADGHVHVVTSEDVPAHRASNTLLLTVLDGLLARTSLTRENVSLVAVGCGPGSFTGVRIALATAKGISSALGVPLVGISTLSSVAWRAWDAGVRGRLLVAGDAMRKEIYPAWFQLDEAGAHRLTEDRVVKANAFAEELPQDGFLLTGDALTKYSDTFHRKSLELSDSLWAPSGEGLLFALQSRLEEEGYENAARMPSEVLPIYTRLSDAEESERIRLADTSVRDLHTGVQHKDACAEVRPFSAAYAQAASSLEHAVMGSDAWSSSAFADELDRSGRVWWMAVDEDGLLGYAGALVIDGDAQILKIAVVPDRHREHLASKMLARVLEDARNLGARSVSLEVRTSNDQAIAFYEAIGMESVGIRPGYYSDHEDARMYKGSLDRVLAHLDRANPKRVAGIGLDERERGSQSSKARPLILAIETSCDETAGAVTDGKGVILSDVVASQIDFHARFGGVVPEIASRKHIEAICGVAEAALEDAGCAWTDLDAVAATYAPGLVGALVVGVAFAKGAAWALDVPYIGVNHLEGHIYANKLGCAEDAPFQPPAIVSLLSGGNTLLVHMRDWQDYDVLGSTIDDAVGEAFDKVAKALGLPYPGGPQISRLAQEGRPDAIDFPRALLHSKDYRFSLSGLKTAVITYIREAREAGTLKVADVCASFEAAVIDVQVAKAAHALEETGAHTLALGGGVAANPELRQAYEDLCIRKGIRLVVPPVDACGDNAAMIALVALDRFNQGRFFGLDSDAHAHADLSEPY